MYICMMNTDNVSHSTVIFTITSTTVQAGVDLIFSRTFKIAT